MTKLIKILLITLLIPMTFAMAKTKMPIIGEVTIVEGRATILPSHKNHSSRVKKGMEVRSGSSIYCNENCNVSIKLNNKLSFVKIGPHTKVVLFHNQETKTYDLRLYQGFAKVLFKRTEKVHFMNIDMGSSIIKLKNNKVLAINTSLFNRTSLITYKGIASFKSKIFKTEIFVSEREYSYLEEDMSQASNPELLTQSRYDELISAFNISKTELSQ